MINQFDALTQARAALEALQYSIVAVSRARQRPVITVDCMGRDVAGPAVELVVKQNGVQRTVRTSRIHECQIIWG